MTARGFVSLAVVGTVGLAVLAPRAVEWSTRPRIPPHMLHHPVHAEQGLLSPALGAALLEQIQTVGAFRTNTRDGVNSTHKHEHVGEAEPVGPDGVCAHPYLIKSNDGTKCVLPERIDLARHFIQTGGVAGLKEPYESLASRLQSFGSYNFDLDKHEVTRGLFNDPKFQRLAKSVCPKHQQHLDPFQFNFIIQLPGQSVATHVDGVYFWGATRFQVPQWLLAAMQFSGLFADRLVEQVQVVAYIHQWDPDDPSIVSKGGGGDFVYWNDPDQREPRRVRPAPLAGSAVDGSKTVHAALIYQQHVPPPFLDKEREHELAFQPNNDTWTLLTDSRPVRSFATDELRISVVYRARCFKDPNEADRFRGPDGVVGGQPEDILPLDTILNTFLKDLVARKQWPSDSADLSAMDSATSFRLAMRIMDTYIKYPPPRGAVVPLNYCVLPRLVRWTTPLVKLLGCVWPAGVEEGV